MQMRLPELKAIEQPERICSCCKVGKLITIQHFDRRGPSQTDIGMGQKSLKVSDNLQKPSRVIDKNLKSIHDNPIKTGHVQREFHGMPAGRHETLAVSSLWLSSQSD
jgi:hypothetical protein